MKRKKLMICILLAVFALLCTGCDLDAGGSLFALPELSGQYAHLQKELDKILADGATYTAANTGSVRSSVQMADLNGDGREEAIGLFLSAEGVPEVHVFRMTENDCTWLGKLEGAGTGVREIRYFSRGTQGQRAMAVSWAYENNARYYGMTVAGVGGGELFTMLDLQYAACLPQDLDGDGVEELTYVRPGGSDEPYYACIYQLEGGSYQLLCQAPLSVEIQQVLQLRYGSVAEGENALVVDSSAQSGGYVTDVLTFDGEQLVNITRNALSGSGMDYWRQIAVPAHDINQDGLLELPVSIVSSNAQSDYGNRVYWMALDGQGQTKILHGAYHHVEEGWAILWPEEWSGASSVSVHAERSQRENVATTAFYIWQADPETGQLSKRTLLTIWAFQGEDRERERALHYLVQPLNTSGDILFGYTLPVEAVSDGYSLTGELVERVFCRVTDSLEGGNE